MTERKKRRGCAGVTFSEHERQRSKRSLIARSDLWPVLRGDWALHCPWVTPSVPLLYCSSSVPRFLGYFKAWSCSSGAVPLFKQSSTSDSYMAGEWLGGEGGGDCLTDAQQGFVSGPLWSYWLTDTCRVAKSDLCVCECVWRATSHRSWWVLSEGITTKRDKCFVCYLVHSQLWAPPLPNSRVAAVVWHSAMAFLWWEGMKRHVLWLSGPSQSGRWLTSMVLHYMDVLSSSWPCWLT